MTSVINIKDAPRGWQNNPDYVYIGRPGKGMYGPWGNHHPIGFCKRCGAAHTRGEAVEAHRKDFMGFLSLPPSLDTGGFCADLAALKGKILVCFCKPLACHGDVLAEIADSL